ncbi:MAG: PD-(D/E)XK nuclease family protein [Coriobacteriia bacterium]|nr:PD-(D/E)XK nuclease family protein [Coriobacteriia bacterium]
MSVFSHSRIESFETCPKKYEFAYLLKVPRGPEGVEAFAGQRFHEAMEWLYGEVRACRVPAEEEVVEVYNRAWETEWTDAVVVTRKERTAEDYRAIGEKAVRAYCRRYHPYDQGTTVGLEQRISLRLDDDHEIAGYVDRITKAADGVWEIHDYKTSNSLMPQEKADADRQLALYDAAVREMYPDARQVSLVWHFVVFDHEVRSCRSEEQLADLRTQVLEQVRHIEAQTHFPAKVTALCDWCDYKAACPAWRHQFETAALPPDEFASESGVALVDEYMRACEESTTLDRRKEALKEALVRRATDEGLERLFGTEYAIKVFRFDQVSVPDAKDPRRAALEEALREMGLYDRFSSLSPYMLSRAVQDGVLDADEMARLEEFLTRGEGTRLYPRKIT